MVRAPNVTRGFTLIEMMMVSLVLGLLVTSVFSVVRTVRLTAASAGNHLAAVAQARAALDNLTRDLSSMLPTTAAAVVALGERAAAPLPGVLSFVGLRHVDAIEGPWGPETVRVEYRLVAAAARDAPWWLVRRTTVFPTPHARLPAVRKFLEPRELQQFSIVAGRLESLRLRFRDGKQWVTTWNRPLLPTQVEIEAATRVSDGLLPFVCRTIISIPCAAVVARTGPGGKS